MKDNLCEDINKVIEKTVEILKERKISEYSLLIDYKGYTINFDVKKRRIRRIK